MGILVSVLISDISFGVVELPNVNTSKFKQFFQELTNIFVKQFLLVLMCCDLSLKLIDVILFFVLFDLMQLLLFGFKCQIRLVDFQAGFNRLCVSDKTFELFLIVGVIFEPMSKVLDWLVGLFSIDTGKPLCNDFADFILLEISNSLLVHSTARYINK